MDVIKMQIIDQFVNDKCALYNGDCVEIMNMLPANSVGYSIFSPPYSNLYAYSNSERDIGNCRSDVEFFTHFDFVIQGLMRIMMPGRNVSVDCMNLPAMKSRDGYIGLKDFRGALIAAFIKHGFIYHSEHVIWKDPLIEATRTKAIGLMHKQLCKDSALSRAGLPQYLLTFRKPGVNTEPVAHEHGLTEFIGNDEPTDGNLSHNRWRRYASPVWMDVRSSRTLNYRGGRDDEDERHICPMALDIIERGVELWSNPGDIVFDPFSGIGSTAHCAIKAGRKFAGSELKPSYFNMAVNNLAELFNRKLFLNLQTFAVIECHDGSIVANDQFQDVTGDPIWEACA
jgi:DNA modification methylase